MQKPTKRTKVKEVVKEVKQSYVTFVGDTDLMHCLDTSDLLKIKKAFDVSIDIKQDKFFISSPNIFNSRKAANLLEILFDWFDSDLEVTSEDVDNLVLEYLPKPFPGTKYKGIFTNYLGEEISPRTENQDMFIKTIRNKKISVGYGSSGGGKTFCALLMGLKFVLDGRFDSMVICRPLVTVGKDIGFLPGDLSEKIGHYFGAITDLLEELLGEKGLEQMMNEKKIVFMPTSFLRGATLRNYVVIDESQNLTSMEMRTICSRLDRGSKMVILGDSKQSDFNNPNSGLDMVVNKLRDIDRIGFVKFSEADIQRDPIIGEILRAFE